MDLFCEGRVPGTVDVERRAFQALVGVGDEARVVSAECRCLAGSLGLHKCITCRAASVLECLGFCRGNVS